MSPAPPGCLRVQVGWRLDDPSPRRYSESVPYLVDGNNLIHAFRKTGTETGREGLCALLSAYVNRGETVTVIFDGPPPPAGMERQIAETGVLAEFSGHKPADGRIIQLIGENTAPRRLHVVSTDREIRRAARRRRCKVHRSEHFVDDVLRANRPRRPRVREPKEKRTGLSEEQTRRWLAEFGYEPDPPPPDPTDRASRDAEPLE